MEAINLAAFGLTFLLSLAVAAEVLRSGAISLWDGFLYADSLSALVILLTASVALVCAVYAVGYLREDERSGALDEESGSRAVAGEAAQVLHPDAAVCVLHAAGHAGE